MLGRYFVGVGAFRFALEFVRVNVRVLGPLTVAHLFALGVVALGVVILATAPAVRSRVQTTRHVRRQKPASAGRVAVLS